MRLSLESAPAFLSLVLIGACAHRPPPPPQTGATTLTSTQLPGQLPGSAPASVDDTFAPTELPPMAQWAWQYPDAARALGAWALSNPDAARVLARWELAHREQLATLVDWAVAHPHESLGAFLLDRTGWEELQWIAEATDDLPGFMAWMRREPEAARELSLHSDGLVFAGTHAAALARMSHVESELRAFPRGRPGGDMPLPGEPVPLAPKNDAEKGGNGVRPPLE